MLELLSPLDILSMSHVMRWHTVRTHRAQNLAEHSFRVAALAVWLGRHQDSELFTDQLELATWRLAALHDFHEVEFGDLPTPAKRALELGHRGAVDTLMDLRFWVPRGGSSTPWRQAPKLARRLVRVADALDAASFYWAEGLTSTRPGTPDLFDALVEEVWSTVDRAFPALEPLVSQVLVEAGIPESMAYRFPEGGGE